MDHRNPSRAFFYKRPRGQQDCRTGDYNKEAWTVAGTRRVDESGNPYWRFDLPDELERHHIVLFVASGKVRVERNDGDWSYYFTLDPLAVDIQGPPGVQGNLYDASPALEFVPGGTLRLRVRVGAS